jgi:hypothetical protein
MNLDSAAVLQTDERVHRSVDTVWCGAVVERLRARLKVMGGEPLDAVSPCSHADLHDVHDQDGHINFSHADLHTDVNSHHVHKGTPILSEHYDIASDCFVVSANEIQDMDLACKMNTVFWLYNPTETDSLLSAAMQMNRAAVICVPICTRMTAFTKGLTLLGQISKRSVVLTQQIKNIPRRAPSNMNVWYKPAKQVIEQTSTGDSEIMQYDPVQVILAATTLFSLVPAPSTTHTFQFAGDISGIPAAILLDTGADATLPVPYISAQFCVFHHIKVDKCRTADSVQGITNSNPESVVGTAHVRMTIGSFTQYVRCTVIALTETFDVILSDKWLKSVKARIDYGPTERVVIKSGQKKHVLIPITLNRQRVYAKHSSMSAPKILSYLATKRAIRKGSETTLLLVRENSHSSVPSSFTQNQPPTTPPNSSIPLMSQSTVDKIVSDYATVFTTQLPYGGSHIRLEEVIPTIPGSRPINRPVFRYSPMEMAEIERQISELISLGYIQPSSSAWGAPVLLVKKPHSSELRMVIDYRALNAVTNTIASPLPPIDTLLTMIAGAKVFSTLDLSKAYHQCKLIDSDIPKTAFKTPFGHYEYLTLSFGLKNAPSRFQAMMNNLFRAHLNKFVLIYLDDICIISKSAEEHEKHLRIVLDILKHNNLTCNVQKCNLNQTELLYVGHIISAEGIKADPAKIKAIVQYPRPTDIRGMRSFLGMANYFRKFINKFAIIARPLTNMLRKDTNITKAWDDIAEKAFIDLKDALSAAPVLIVPDWKSTEPFQLVTDASYQGIAGILMQDHKVVAYESRKLIPAEQNYSPTELEMLAIDHCCKVFRCYIEGRKTIVYSDHKPNTTFPTMQMPTRRHARWLERLQGFDLDWQYIKGQNNIADGLSRNPPPSMVGSFIIAAKLRSQKKLKIYDLIENNEFLMRLTAAYAKDPHFQSNVPNQYTKSKGLFYCEGRLVIPDDPDIKNDVLLACHSAHYSGHLGKTKTLDLARRYFQWKSMHATVKKFLKHCDCCQRNKTGNPPPHGLLVPMPIPDRNWESISMDFITKLPPTQKGHTSIFVVVDRLSKMCKIAPCYDTSTAEDVAKIFRDIVFCNFGLPKDIVSDRDSRFKSTFWTELCRLIDVTPKMSTAFHPETDGQTERVNRTLQQVLRTSVNSAVPDWDEHLPLVEFAINNSYHESVKNTPFFLNYGRHPDIPISSLIKRHKHAQRAVLKDSKMNAYAFVDKMNHLVTQTKKAMQSAQAKYKHYADTQRKDIKVKEGQMVLLSTKNMTLKDLGTKKFLPKFIGPFKIVKVINKVAVKLELPEHMQIHNVFHVSLIKPYFPDGNESNQPSPVLVDGNIEWEVEKVMDHRDKKRGSKLVREYRIRFKGYTPADDMWLPIENLNCSEKVHEYWESHPTESAHSQNRPQRKRRTTTQPSAELKKNMRK